MSTVDELNKKVVEFYEKYDEDSLIADLDKLNKGDTLGVKETTDEQVRQTSENLLSLQTLECDDAPRNEKQFIKVNLTENLSKLLNTNPLKYPDASDKPLETVGEPVSNVDTNIIIEDGDFIPPSMRTVFDTSYETKVKVSPINVDLTPAAAPMRRHSSFGTKKWGVQK